MCGALRGREGTIKVCKKRIIVRNNASARVCLLYSVKGCADKCVNSCKKR